MPFPNHLKNSMLVMALLAVAFPAAAYDAGNYRRDMDEANRQRMASEFRRDAETSARRNDELRRSNAYQAPSSSGTRTGDSAASRQGSSVSSGGGAGSSDPLPIESTTTVTVKVKESEPETVQRILKEAAAGNVESQWNAGRLYFTGGYGGVAKDDAKAAMWFRKAAEGGNASAAQAYGEMAFSGKGVAKSDAEAGTWFKFAAEKGIPRAMFFWGTFLEVGHGVPRNDGAAFGWIKKAAEQQESYAYGSLGAMYEEGRGTPVNLVEAVKWLRLAVDHGDASASVGLGSLYLQGKGVAKNEAEAGKLFLKGAEGGSRNGMANAGIMFEQGILGISKDLEKARYWYEKAGAAGDPEAKQAAERLAQTAKPAPTGFTPRPMLGFRISDEPVPKEASVNGKYDGLVQEIACPKDRAQYGEFKDFGQWDGGPWCGQQGKRGYWVWVAPTWYVWSVQVR